MNLFGKFYKLSVMIKNNNFKTILLYIAVYV